MSGISITLSRGLEIVKTLPGRSQTTAEWYENAVGDFIEYIGDMAAVSVTPRMVADWYQDLELRPTKKTLEGTLAPATRNSYGRAVRAYFGHLQRVGHIKTNPAEHLRPAHVPRNKLKAISEYGISEMLRIAQEDERDFALIHTFRSTGARLSEVVAMRVSSLEIEEHEWTPDDETAQLVALARQLRLEEIIYPEYRVRLRGRAHVTGKGHSGRPKERYIFLDNECCHAIRRYLALRPKVRFDELWLTRQNQPIRPNAVYHMLRKYGELAGVKLCNPHAFRHAAAKRWISRGMPHKVVQELLGHEEISTTLDIYVQYDAGELSEWHDRFSR